jgi:hypothetical protein
MTADEDRRDENRDEEGLFLFIPVLVLIRVNPR